MTNPCFQGQKETPRGRRRAWLWRLGATGSRRPAPLPPERVAPPKPPGCQATAPRGPQGDKCGRQARGVFLSPPPPVDFHVFLFDFCLLFVCWFLFFLCLFLFFVWGGKHRHLFLCFFGLRSAFSFAAKGIPFFGWLSLKGALPRKGKEIKNWRPRQLGFVAQLRGQKWVITFNHD